MKKTMQGLCITLMQTIALLVLSVSAMAQDVITGKITSATGAPIPGVTVTIKSSRTSTQTAADGTYRITAPKGATLVFTSAGLATRELPANNSVLNLEMAPSNLQLNEVVVVAYGTRKKSELTSAIVSVSAKDFQKGAIYSSEQLLQGKVAGLQITTGGGAAGGGSTIRIRGGSSISASNDPLIVIDGVPVDNNNLPGSANYLNTINPNDIESMSVLKDASATALYGSRASNGVIIITTKKGTRGKVRFNFNTQAAVGTIAKKVDVLSANEIRQIIEADAAATGSNTYKNLLGSANTDWQDEIYQSAFGSDNNLSASGAIGFLPFRISLGYFSQDGIL